MKQTRHTMFHPLKGRLFLLALSNQLTVRTPRGPAEDEGQDQEPRAGPE